MAGRPLIRLTAVAVAVGLLAGCGSAHRDQTVGRISGSRLSIYVSVPAHGASAASGAAIVNGARIALDESHARLGRYRLVLRRLDDSNPTRGGWDPGKTSDDAKLAAGDPTTIGYVGDPDSGASAISIPVLNRAGIAQVSPTSMAVGLTSAGPGAAPGEPDKYYPTGVRTFARVAPSDAAQAEVQVRLQRSLGCGRTYVVDDGEVDGEDMATSFDLAARAKGPQVVATQQFDPRATDYLALANSIAATGSRCVLISAITDSNAVAVTRQLAAALPTVRIFATAGLAETTYARGVSSERVLITSPALGASAYPAAGRAWLKAYTRRYGSPEPDAILGYMAMDALLEAIADATDHGRKVAERAKVVGSLLATSMPHSVLGNLSIDRNGETSSRQIGVWIAEHGELRYWRTFSG